MKRFLPILALVLAACSPGGAQEKKAADAKGAQPAAVPVTAIEVAPRPVPVSFDAVGRTEGSREVQVRARVAGIIERQLYNEGDYVKAGAPLFRLERAPYEIELQQARGTLAQELARNDLAKREYERAKDLVAKRFVSQQNADQAAANLAQSNAAVQVARARVRQTELNVSYTEVNAAIAGVTGRALQSIGSLVSPSNDTAVLTTLTRGDPIWVRFGLSEKEYSRLRGSKQIKVKIELADGSPYAQSGKLNFAGSTVDATTGTVQMRAELPNPKLVLLPGQYVRVQVIAGTQQAIVVPQTAIGQNEAGRYVWIIENQKAVQRPIRAGNWVGADWVVLEGLKPGEQVIVDNLVRLRPGAAVQVKKAG